VTFGDARADVMRRDFTINGMLYDPRKNKVIDYVEGREDLKNRVVRCIGEPRERFAEDKLRMLRAVRFSARLGFEIEPATRVAISEYAPQVIAVSQERIRAELEQILTCDAAADGVMELHELGLLRQVLPEVGATTEIRPANESLLEHSVSVLRVLSGRKFELALAALLHCTAGLPEDEKTEESAKLASVAARRLKCSNSERSSIVWLIRNQYAFADPQSRRLSYLKRLFAHAEFENLLALIDAKVQAGCTHKSEYDYVKRLHSRLSPEEIRPEPLLGGNDLIEMGLKPSELFTVILDRVYDAQLDGELADRGSAIEMALQIARET
jgi:tRNA nucleotidyltransferase/poly(A) polymerase